MDRAIGKMNVGRLFGVPAAPEFRVTPIDRAVCAITRLQRHVGDPVQGSAVNIPARDAYFLMLYLQDAFHCDLLSNSEKTTVRKYAKGAICLVDLQEGASIELHSDLDAISFLLPRALFDELSAVHLSQRFNGLKCVRAMPDGIMTSIGSAIVPFFEQVSEGIHSLDHIAIAICAHVMHYYSDLSVAQKAVAIGPAPTSLADGDAPEPCLGEALQTMPQRLGLAKRLLENGLMSLKEITVHCGFSGVRQFCDTFRRETGMSPSDWKKCKLH